MCRIEFTVPSLNTAKGAVNISSNFGIQLSIPDEDAIVSVAYVCVLVILINYADKRLKQN